MTTASRIEGVAPLAVFFDAVDSVASGVSGMGAERPFHDLYYEWDFDDPTSGNWTTTGKSKNQAIGAVAAHVFDPSLEEFEGAQTKDYIVRLLVSNGTQTEEYEQTITVTNPESIYVGTKTRCVSTTGDFSGSPPGAELVISSDFVAQVSWLFSSDGPRRLLFRRGETLITYVSYTSPTNKNGPYTIGAYGTGEMPIIYSMFTEDNCTTLGLSNTVTDIRIVAIDFKGSRVTDDFLDIYGTAIRSGTNMLLYKTKVRAHTRGVVDTGSSKNNNFFIDNEFLDNAFYGIYLSNSSNPTMEHIGIMGNVFVDTYVSEGHLLRTYISKSVISHNRFGDIAGHQIKFVGEDPPKTAEYDIISDNVFLPSPMSAWKVAIGPESNHYDQRVVNVIVERNSFNNEGDPMSVNDLLIWAKDVTIRNNLFDRTNSGSDVAIIVTQRGIEPPPEKVEIYNNVLYRGDPASSLDFVNQGTACLDQTQVKNNIVYAPATSSVTIGSGDLNAQNNIVKNTVDNDLFVDPANGDFHLKSSATEAIDQGTNVLVWDDFDGNPRPYGSNWDIGAFEYLGTSITEGPEIAAGVSFMCYNNIIHSKNGKGVVMKVGINEPSRVRIVIYDASGRTIRTVVDEDLRPWTYYYSWKGKDANENIVGSGIYFACLELGNHRDSKKVVVIK